ncbi:helix-turn-helix transcriptional regulator [Streptomyces sp. PU_AKi4]|uniref:helix-turn-helix transcriptional regulator n=1 Tax=Streptomyces sp. PU_AKi4 TaxID=2800809 RepID=UPI003526337C
MDYYERIQLSIEFIEENLQNNISIKDISSKSCFSAFHFQRLFQAITGFSVQEYIRNFTHSDCVPVWFSRSVCPCFFTILWGDTRQVSKRGNGVKETKQNGFFSVSI